VLLASPVHGLGPAGHSCPLQRRRSDNHPIPDEDERLRPQSWLHVDGRVAAVEPSRQAPSRAVTPCHDQDRPNSHQLRISAI
jgi:hypothetical protein